MDRELQRVYLDAEYRVHLVGSTVSLYADRFDTAADSMISRTTGVTREWSIITPFNPHSVRLCEHENSSHLEDFYRMLLATGRQWFPCSNHDPQAIWPDEAGALIVDIPMAQAKEFGKQFGQNAILYGVPGVAPQLLWL